MEKSLDGTLRESTRVANLVERACAAGPNAKGMHDTVESSRAERKRKVETLLSANVRFLPSDRQKTREDLLVVVSVKRLRVMILNGTRLVAHHHMGRNGRYMIRRLLCSSGIYVVYQCSIS